MAVPIRTKVILHRRDWDDDRKLSLTDEQITLLEWLLDKDILCSDTWDLQVLEESEVWEEI